MSSSASSGCRSPLGHVQHVFRRIVTVILLVFWAILVPFIVPQPFHIIHLESDTVCRPAGGYTFLPMISNSILYSCFSLRLIPVKKKLAINKCMQPNWCLSPNTDRSAATWVITTVKSCFPYVPLRVCVSWFIVSCSAEKLSVTCVHFFYLPVYPDTCLGEPPLSQMSSS